MTFSKAPISNPVAHQGRTRTHAHVDGQWAAHVYIPVPVEISKISRDAPSKNLTTRNPKTKFGDLLQRVIETATQLVPELHSLLPEPIAQGSTSVPNHLGSSKTGDELHISLSRPIFLRAHQRDEFRKAIKMMSLSHELCVMYTFSTEII